jgi:hypothetical protein
MCVCPLRNDNVFEQERASRKTGCTSTIVLLLSSPFLLALIQSPWRRISINIFPCSVNVGPFSVLTRQRWISARMSLLPLSRHTFKGTYPRSSRSFGRTVMSRTFSVTGNAIVILRPRGVPPDQRRHPRMAPAPGVSFIPSFPLQPPLFLALTPAHLLSLPDLPLCAIGLPQLTLHFLYPTPGPSSRLRRPRPLLHLLLHVLTPHSEKVVRRLKTSIKVQDRRS